MVQTKQAEEEEGKEGERPGSISQKKGGRGPASGLGSCGVASGVA